MLDATRKALIEWGTHSGRYGRREAALAEVAAAERVIEAAEVSWRTQGGPEEIDAWRDLGAALCGCGKTEQA